MKRVLGLLAALLLASGIIIAAPPRHMNPEEVAPRRLDLETLTRAASSLVEFVSGGYLNISRLTVFRIDVSTSPELTYALYNMREQFIKINQRFNISQSYLEQVDSLVRSGRMIDALVLLNEIMRAYSKAGLKSGDFELATNELQRRLGGAVELLARFTYMKSTEITVSVEPQAAWVGSTVRIAGKLTSLGDPLPGKRVFIVFNGSILGNELTDSNGYFTYQLKLPYAYKKRVPVGVLYVPEADDARVYRPSANSVEIELLYEIPRIDVRIDPPTALVGDPIEVEIRTDKPDLQIEIRAFGLSRVIKMNETSARLLLRIPSRAARGMHLIRVISRPNGTLGPANYTTTLFVRKLDLQLNVTAPSIVIAAFPANFRVCVDGWGEVQPNYTIKLELHGSIVELQSQRSCAILEIMVPPLSPTGSSIAEVQVIPENPRYGIRRAKVQVFVVNPFLLILTLSSLAFFLFLIRPRKTSPKSPVFVVSQPPEQPMKLEIPYSITLKSEDPIVNEYLEAVRRIERAINLHLKPSHTISEYLKLVEPKLGKAAKTFALLSLIAEAKLYGEISPSPEVIIALRKQLEEALGDEH